jgi:EAL and modified HD-GYP domain-containing signal transduction protein
MASWLSRWFGRAADASAASGPPSAAGAAGAAGATGAAPAAAAPAEPAGPATRRPLIDRQGRLAGFEFPLPDLLARRLQQGASEAVVGAHASALLAAMRPTVAAGRVALVGLPAALLARPALLQQLPTGLWLVLEPADFGAAGASHLDALRAAGVVAGVAQVPQRGAGFVRVDATGLDRAAALAALAACRAAAPRAQVVAAGLADVEDVEAALAAGADLAAGAHDHLRAMAPAAALPPSMARVTRLLNQVLQDAELGAIAAELRADVGLAYELLRHANSPLLGLQRKVDAVDQAVMLLGRDALYRWLCAHLVAATPARPATRALQEIALARAFLFERLAPACGASASALYTLGLLSLLDVMVPMPMAAAVAPLNLPADLRAALVEHQGPWGALIPLAWRLERGDPAGAEPLAAGFGGLAAVTEAHALAWQAAAEAAALLWPRP